MGNKLPSLGFWATPVSFMLTVSAERNGSLYDFKYVVVDYVRMAYDTRYSIIEELRDLGVNVCEILSCNPSDHQLQDMRDGLLKLSRATKVVSKYRTFENKAIPIFVKE